MTTNLLSQLEQKIEHAIEIIELMRLQIEELEEENAALRSEHEKWKNDLSNLLNRLDNINETSDESTPEETEAEAYDFAEAP